jgi:hypothetical protein
VQGCTTPSAPRGGTGRCRGRQNTELVQCLARALDERHGASPNISRELLLFHGEGLSTVLRPILGVRVKLRHPRREMASKQKSSGRTSNKFVKSGLGLTFVRKSGCTALIRCHVRLLMSSISGNSHSFSTVCMCGMGLASL